MGGTAIRETPNTQGTIAQSPIKFDSPLRSFLSTARGGGGGDTATVRLESSYEHW